MSVHEYPLVQTIINKAAAQAAAHNSRRVRRIALVVGDSSGYVPESIQMYFDIIAEGSVCADAILDIKRIKPKWECTGCGLLFERRPFSFACPACGADSRPTDVGREFYIESIDIDVENDVEKGEQSQ